MSEVISFRLDPDNLREGEALRIIDEWREKGYPLRFILVEALIALSKPPTETELRVTTQMIKDLLFQVKHGSGVASEQQSNEEMEMGNGLPQDFKSAICLSIKPGMTID